MLPQQPTSKFHGLISTSLAVCLGLCLCLCLSLCLFSSGRLLAEELPEGYVPVKSMGMGGVSTSVSDDENSVFTNPAGIARVRKARSRKTNNLTSFPNLVLGINGESKKFYEMMKKADDKSVESILASSDDIGNKPFWARASAFPVTMLEMSPSSPIALGLFANNTANFFINKDEPEVARTRVISDIGAAIGIALTDKSNRFNLGLSIRPTYRYAYEDKIPSDILLNKTELAARVKDGSNKSSGIGIDVGMMYTLADFWYPTVGLALLNLPTGCKAEYLNPHSETRQTVCGTVFTGDIANPEALSNIDPTDIRVGFSLMPRFTRKVAIRLALEAHHIHYAVGASNYGLSDVEISKLVHGGAELILGNPLDPEAFKLRLGANQGFITYGASMTMGVFALEFSSYGVDVSTTSKPIEDRRFLLGLTLEF